MQATDISKVVEVADQSSNVAGMRMPAVYLAHGAPPLMDDPVWPRELADWALRLPRPKAILVVSAHWESAPVTIGATSQVPLIYDFSGFPARYYEVTYASPGAPWLAERVRRLLSNVTLTADAPTRGLDHGAYVPLLAMYPDADVPVLQISMPSEDPKILLEVGRRLAPLRDEGVLIMGSGFLTHSFDAARRAMAGGDAVMSAVAEFDQWAAEALARHDIDGLLDYRNTSPALRYVHPTVDHFVPLFIALGASLEEGAIAETRIDGFWIGNSKRSVEFA